MTDRLLSADHDQYYADWCESQAVTYGCLVNELARTGAMLRIIPDPNGGLNWALYAPNGALTAYTEELAVIHALQQMPDAEVQ
jgi:hypothetical protein